VLAVISSLCLLAVVGVLASLFFKNEWLALGGAAVVVAILVVGRYFGHAELSLLGQKIRRLVTALSGSNEVGQILQGQITLQGSVEWKELWALVVKHGPDQNWKTVVLDVNAPALHESYFAYWSRSSDHREEPDVWRAELPIISNRQTIARLEVVGYIDPDPIWQKFSDLAKLVQDLEETVSRLTANLWNPVASANGVGYDTGHGAPLGMNAFPNSVGPLQRPPSEASAHS
jgi:UDP-GlcNAc:undecaprenyl-phosphate GlcNAc-1-phosphate transferase